MWDLFISDHRVIHILCVSVQGVIIVLQAFLSRGWSSTRSFGICPEIHSNFLSLSRSSLNHFNFCPGGHYDLLFLSRRSQWFTIFVQGVTTIYYFCPGGHSVLYFCLGGHYGPLCMSRGKSSILSSVLVERSSKQLSRGYILKKFYCPGG